MANWSIDYEHDSDEVIALKKHIANQDNKCSALEDQLYKSKLTHDETKSILAETIQKLRHESDIAVSQNEDITSLKEELDREKLHRHNTETSLHAATSKIKEDEAAMKQLQMTIEAISTREICTARELAEVQNKNAALEFRARDLEANLQQVVDATSPVRKGRLRSSSLSEIRISSLEHDLSESKAALAQAQSDLVRASEKLSRTEANQVQTENEAITMEKRLKAALKTAEDNLAEKEDELRFFKLQHGGGLAQEREEELVNRIEEEEAKSEALHMAFADAERNLQKMEKGLKAEIVKVKGLEGRNATLTKEKDQLRKAMETARSRTEALASTVEEKESLIATLSTQTRTLRDQLNHSQTVNAALTESRHGAGASPEDASDETVQRLLIAIDRLRGERDGLRRDLEFSQAESKFAIQGLEAQLEDLGKAGALHSPRCESPSSSLDDVLTLREETLQLRAQRDCVTTRLDRLAQMVAASMIVVGYMDSKRLQRIDHLEEVHAELSHLRLQYDDVVSTTAAREDTIHALEHSIQELQAQLEQSNNNLSASDAARAQLQLQVHDLADAKLRARGEQMHLQNSLEQREAQLEELLRTLQSVESDRDSLSNQVITLQQDLEDARGELTQAEQRYSELQSQQFSSLSSDQILRSFKDQIKEYQERVERRNEQIGIHQHDIKRLETNLRLQEERLAELTAELEVTTSEKQSMIEDCAEAREARDIADSRIETLEEEAEALESTIRDVEYQRVTETAALIGVWSSTVVRSRMAVSNLRVALYSAHHQNALVAEQLELSNSHHGQVAAASADVVSSLAIARHNYDHATDETRQAVIALAISQTGLHHVKKVQAASQRYLEGQLYAVRQELSARLTDIGTIHRQLESAQSQQELDISASAAQQARVAQLEAEIEQLHQRNTELESREAELQARVLTYQGEIQKLDDQEAERVGSFGDQMMQIREEHRSEIDSLQEELGSVTAELLDARTALEEARASRQKVLEQSSEEKRVLDERLQDCLAQLEATKQTVRDAEALQTTRADEIRALQEALSKAESEFDQARLAQEELEASRVNAIKEASEAHQSAEERYKESEAATKAVEDALEQAKACHADELAILQQTLEAREADVMQLQEALEDGRNQYANAAQTFEEERNNLTEHYEATQAKLREDIQVIQGQLKETEAALESVQEERAAFEQETTDLEAARQRLNSMVRHTESRLQDSQREVEVLRAQLCHAEEQFASFQAAAQTKEMQFDLEANSHRSFVADLHKQIDALEARPKLDDTVHELEERIKEMDKLMSDKNQEIENNDDRVIGMLKEKKKLTTRVDNLTRKVQSLQNKLAMAKEAFVTRAEQPVTSTSRNTPPPSSRTPTTRMDIEQPIASTSRQSPATFSRPQPLATKPATMPPLPPVPSEAPVTPRSRMRMASGPSALPRPKTPDSRIPPIFRVKTPEARQVSKPAFSDGPMPTITSIGKKRAAPDDAEESPPAQGFTIEGTLDRERNGDSTPRVRKSFRGTGFTPVRHTTARPVTVAPVSPIRPSSSEYPNLISDVTNSPRGSSHAARVTGGAAKRGTWVSKLKSSLSSSQSGAAPPRTTYPTRPPIFQKAP